MYAAQAQLADAHIAANMGPEARFIAEDLVAREPWERANIERFRRSLVILGETDPDGVIAERLSGSTPFMSTDVITRAAFPPLDVVSSSAEVTGGGPEGRHLRRRSADLASLTGLDGPGGAAGAGGARAGFGAAGRDDPFGLGRHRSATPRCLRPAPGPFRWPTRSRKAWRWISASSWVIWGAATPTSSRVPPVARRSATGISTLSSGSCATKRRSCLRATAGTSI
jgi:hypothetical protein